MNTRSRKLEALQNAQSNSPVADGVTGCEEPSAKKLRRSKRIATTATSTASTASTSTVTVSTSGRNSGRRREWESNSPAALRALLPKLCDLDFPAPTKEQLILKKRIHSENQAIIRQQAQNRLVPTQRALRISYELEMSSIITQSGKGTYKNNPAKTRSVLEARAALREVKLDRDASISALANQKYNDALERLFTDINEYPYTPNPEWMVANMPQPKVGFSSTYRPLSLASGEDRYTAKSLLLEYTIAECTGCGCDNPVINNNSHLNSDDKTRSAGNHSGSVSDNVMSIAAVKLEEPKMKAECANCHQKDTAIARRLAKTPYDELVDPGKQVQRDLLYARINELKEMSGCSVCFMRDSDCLLIDHSNRWGKRWNISRMISDGCDWIDIVEEIENGECCVMCHNCHTIKGFVEGESC